MNLKHSHISFSILIPTWNNLPYLQLVIRSIREHSSFPHQIIVHVNEGLDGTLDWVKEQKGIDYTFTQENVGICYALNLARTKAQNDYLVYMNDDMYVCPQWDVALMQEIEKMPDKKFFLSSTMIEPTDTKNPCVIVHNFGTDISSFDEQRLLLQHASLHKANWKGATWPPNLVHKELWDSVGGYSIEFTPGWYSDNDFSMKLWHAGVRIFKGVGSSKVYHFGSKSTKRIAQIDIARKLFKKKWGIKSSVFMKKYIERGTSFI